MSTKEKCYNGQQREVSKRGWKFEKKNKMTRKGYARGSMQTEMKERSALSGMQMRM